MDQRIGTQLGNYRLVELIGKGTFGIVYLAEHVYLHTPAAIKLMHADLNMPGQETLFLQEARTLARLGHPNIVRLLDFGIEEGNPYLVSEYAAGGSLRVFLRQVASQPLPLPNALSILMQVGNALSYIHSQGIIHRDLKPENILLGNHNQVLLADFGIARVKQATGATSTGHISSVMGLGTWAYMAPEQFQAKGRPLPESDQYALGCIAYELLTGQLPFTPDDERAYGYLHIHELPDSPRLLNPDIPPHVEQAILTALAKDPARRHASVQAFLVALGIPPAVGTQAHQPSDTTFIIHNQRMDGSDSSTFIRSSSRTLTEGEIETARSPQQSTPPPQFDSTLGRPAPSMWTTPMPTRTRRPTASPSQHTGSTRQALRTRPPLKRVLARTTVLFWRYVHATVAGASTLTRVKWLFLLTALLDLPLLLSGFWFGQSFLTQLGTILAVGICICGLALNFFTEPWVWLVIFLLFSPLAGGIYVFSVITLHAEGGIINWHTYCAYLLLTPLAGFLYGLFGPTRRRGELLAPPFTKHLTLTIWFLGVCISVASIGAPMVVYLGLAWALAAGILAVAQLIRLRQTEWLISTAIISAFTLGIALFALGFTYGAFGPTTEGEPSTLF